MVFHSSVSLEQHLADHQHADELIVSTADTSLDKPLDLSSPVAKTDGESFQLPDVPHLLVEMAEPQPVERAVSKCRKFVCLVCFREYRDSGELLLHQAERHPNIDCRHIEVDQDFLSVDVGMRPRTVGVLNVSSSQLPALPGTSVLSALYSHSVSATDCVKYPCNNFIKCHFNQYFVNNNNGHPDNSHTLLNVSHLGNEVPGSKKIIIILIKL